MGNIGRLVCVALPFALTVASLIALLVAALAGVTDKSLYNFRIDTANLSVSASDIESLLSKRSVLLPDLTARDFGSDISGAAGAIETAVTTTTSNLGDDASNVVSSAAAAASTAAVSDLTSVAETLLNTNITAADLGLADAYYVNLWNYCSVNSNGTTSCPKGKFDWASNATAEFEATYESVVASAGGNGTLPDALKDGMKTFATVAKWTEICFIIAFVSLSLTLVCGLFATCSRAISCCAWVIAGFAVIAVGAAAGLATGMAAVVVGLAEGSSKVYGVTADFNKRFLVTIWVSFAFILVATIFWLASVCCCSSGSSRSSRAVGARGGKDYENSNMTPVGAYAPIHDNHASAYTGAGGAHVQGDNYYHSGDGAKYENYRSH